MVKIGRIFAERLLETGIVLDDSWISEPITMSNGYNFAVNIFIFNDNNAYGFLKVQGRVHSQCDSWQDIPITSDGATYIEINPVDYPTFNETLDIGCLGIGQVRVRYDRTAGSAAMDIHAICKRIY